MTNYREILRLKDLGMAHKDIAASCSCGRNTVTRVLQRAKECGLTWKVAETLSPSDIQKRLFPSPATHISYAMPDYERVHREMQKSGVTLSLLWIEYCDQCRASGKLPYKSTQFNKYYADYVQKTKATMHLEHKPGEKMQVDWAGTTAHVQNSTTGAKLDAYLFVAVLPYSGYAYAEAFWDMKQDSWIAAHKNAFRFFGGVTRILVPDNLKTGVVKNSRSETVINRSYQEMSEYYGTAIIPARPRKPRDKASVEGSVGGVTTWILAALRNRRFFSLAELNQAIEEKLREFNNKPFQKKDGCRASAFEEERVFLLPLPSTPFELAVWKVATVQYNYHVSVEGMNYSVPHEYIKQRVHVRLTRKTVEIFYGEKRIASHPRLSGRSNQYSTNEEHMPPAHKKYLEWNGERFRRWAEKIGPNTAAVVEFFLSAYQVEQQGYKSCMALLKSADTYSSGKLEAACQKLLAYSSRPSLKSVKMLLKSKQTQYVADEASGRSVQGEEPKEGQRNGSSENTVPNRYSFTRGSQYYTEYVAKDTESVTTDTAGRNK